MPAPKQIDFYARLYHTDDRTTEIGPSWGTAPGAFQWVAVNKRPDDDVEVFRREIRDAGYKDFLVNVPEQDDKAIAKGEGDKLFHDLADRLNLDKPRTHRHKDVGAGPNAFGWVDCPTCLNAAAKGLSTPEHQEVAEKRLAGEPF